MGMFDWIVFEMNCPKCGGRVRRFQSKDGPCELKVLLPSRVHTFHTACGVCRTWIEFSGGEQVRPTYEAVQGTTPIPPFD